MLMQKCDVNLIEAFEPFEPFLEPRRKLQQGNLTKSSEPRLLESGALWEQGTHPNTRG
jgi:hypothetical protein